MSQLIDNGNNGKVDKFNQEYLYDLLKKVRKRPGMYLGRESITRLRMLLMGYSMARADLGIGLTQQEREFAGFQNWIMHQYKISSTRGWDDIILSQSQDESSALNLFFKLFDEFKNSDRFSEGKRQEAIGKRQ
jgi:hypothetical protein